MASSHYERGSIFAMDWTTKQRSINSLQLSKAKLPQLTMHRQHCQPIRAHIAASNRSRALNRNFTSGETPRLNAWQRGSGGNGWWWFWEPLVVANLRWCEVGSRP